MQLNKIFNAEDIEVLFAQWENVTGVKPLLLDSDGSVAIGGKVKHLNTEM